MTDKTVNQNTVLAAAPAADDYVPIWDTSAAAYKRITTAYLMGGSMTGNGVIATGGYTLTVPETGTAALLAADNTFTGINSFAEELEGTKGFKSGDSDTMADDTAISITPPWKSGVMIIYCTYYSQTTTRRRAFAIIGYNTTLPIAEIFLQPSTVVETTTGVLTGTTGSDGKLTVSAHTDVEIYVENRLGFIARQGYLFLS